MTQLRKRYSKEHYETSKMQYGTIFTVFSQGEEDLSRRPFGLNGSTEPAGINVFERSSTRYLKSILLAAVLGLQVLFSSSANSATRATVNGNPNLLLYWNTRTIHFWVNENGSSDLDLPASVGATRRAFNLWSSPDCTDLSFVYRGTSNLSATNATTEKADFTNIVVWRKDGWPPPGAPASNYTQGIVSKTTHFYNVDTGEILDADIELNAFEFTFESTSNGSQWDAETIIAHEVGILIGLSASSDQNTLMASALKTSPGIKRRTLSNDDKSGVCSIYPFRAPTPLGPGQLPVVPEVETGTCQFSYNKPQSSSLPLWMLLLIVLVTIRTKERYKNYTCEKGLNH